MRNTLQKLSENASPVFSTYGYGENEIRHGFLKIETKTAEIVDSKTNAVIPNQFGAGPQPGQKKQVKRYTGFDVLCSQPPTLPFNLKAKYTFSQAEILPQAPSPFVSNAMNRLETK